MSRLKYCHFSRSFNLHSLPSGDSSTDKPTNQQRQYQPLHPETWLATSSRPRRVTLAIRAKWISKMSWQIEYQRFRRGEGCIEEGCRARKFYIEDGKKFCQRGHEQAVRCSHFLNLIIFLILRRVSHKRSKMKMTGMHRVRNRARSARRKSAWKRC